MTLKKHSCKAVLEKITTDIQLKVEIEHFAPYLIIALPLAAQTFSSSYRVRLKAHRGGYRTIFILAFVFLILNTLVVFFNKELYLVLDNPKHNFAYNMHVAKDLATALKKKGITCVKTDNKMQERLKFYAVARCNNIILQPIPLESKKRGSVTISYKNKVLYKANVTKVNTK